MASLARRTVGHLPLVIAGVLLGGAGVVLWRSQWFAARDWTGVLAIAIFANAMVAVLPIWREGRRRRRQAELLRFRLWIHFSKLRWLLTHLAEQEPMRTFLSPGYGGEELFGIEVLLAQAHLLDIDEYEWVIFAVNAALPFFGKPIGELAPQAVRLIWTVDATLAQLNRRPLGPEVA
jgi:hypothetical protein